MGDSQCIPVEIRGVAYESIGEAARALGVSQQAVSSARKRGRLQFVGLGLRGNPSATKPITIQGVDYPSRTNAAEILGVSKSAISHAIKRNRLDFVGTGKLATGREPT
jgi:predicted DNA-binding protein (UPF0251 family)